MTLAKGLTVALQVATCIGCACTDERACMGGCHWERVDRAAQVGVCSGCTEHVARWDASERKLAPIAHRRVYNRGYYSRNKKDWKQKYPRRKVQVPDR